MKYRKRENIKTILAGWKIWIMMKRVIPTLAGMGKNYRLHMYAGQSQKQAMPAKKVFINIANIANVKAALTKRTASKGITAKRQWKNATRFFLWQRHF